uniref:23S rRNA (pseudouridine(1915)-N(3))-methyltransferase RlmH n=1 Tax=Staphylococcus epidermidis TaxID=1282 RepID=UPI00119D7F6C
MKGKMLCSEGVGKEVETGMREGEREFRFVIGGWNGVEEEVLERRKYGLCLSNMSFREEMMRVILMEEIYGGLKIMRGEA